MNDEQIDWPADLVTYSERAAYLRGLQASRATTPGDSVPSDRAAVDDPVAADGGWRCFHCDEVFTNKVDAAFHFGYAQLEKPACLVDAVDLRNMELELSRYRKEDTDLHRQIARMESDHQQALMREEEKGYARGLRDAKAESLEGATQAPAEPITPARLLAFKSSIGELRDELMSVHDALAAAPTPVEPATKQQLIDFLATRRQELGGSISDHNNRRLLATRTTAELRAQYERIVENERRAALAGEPGNPATPSVHPSPTLRQEPEAAVDARQQFEAWCVQRWGGHDRNGFVRGPDGLYSLGNVQFAFDAWRAAREAA